MSDTLHTTTRAGQILGGLHRKDVCQLIRDGKLQAKRIQVRGRGGRPRYRVPDSALQKYIDDMPNAFEPGQASPRVEARPSKRARAGEPLDVIRFV